MRNTVNEIQTTLTTLQAQHLDQAVTEQETLQVIEALPSHKEAGPDGLRVEFLKADALTR